MHFIRCFRFGLLLPQSFPLAVALALALPQGVALPQLLPACSWTFAWSQVFQRSFDVRKRSMCPCHTQKDGRPLNQTNAAWDMIFAYFCCAGEGGEKKENGWRYIRSTNPHPQLSPPRHPVAAPIGGPTPELLASNLSSNPSKVYNIWYVWYIYIYIYWFKIIIYI